MSEILPAIFFGHGEFNLLIDYENLGPEVRLSIPTPDQITIFHCFT